GRLSRAVPRTFVSATFTFELSHVSVHLSRSRLSPPRAAHPRFCRLSRNGGDYPQRQMIHGHPAFDPSPGHPPGGGPERQHAPAARRSTSSSRKRNGVGPQIPWDQQTDAVFDLLDGVPFFTLS